MTSDSNYENNCGWALDRIEPFLDDDLSAAERGRFELHVASCETCASELRFAERVVGELRSLPTLSAPERAFVRTQAPSPLRRFLDRVEEGWALARRPAMVAMIVVVAAVGTFVITQRERTAQVAVSEEQIEQAAQETLLAFAYVGKYSKRTGVIIRDEVIEGYVVEPVERAIAGARFSETKQESKRSEK